jgi:hypothetical protein
MFRGDSRDNHDERAGGSADLEPGPAQRRNEEAGDHRAIQPGLRRQPRRDRERHGQRQTMNPTVMPATASWRS